MSTLHCLTVSLAGGGAGLGAAWGEELARSMLADAGFGDVVVHEAPGDPLNAVFVASKPVGLTAPGLTAQAGAAGPADLASTWIPTWRLSRPRMAEMPRRRRGEITRSRPRAV